MYPNTVQEDTDRMNMWAELIPGYLKMKRNQKKHARMQYCKPRGCNPGDIQGKDCLMKNMSVSEFHERLEDIYPATTGSAISMQPWHQMIMDQFHKNSLDSCVKTCPPDGSYKEKQFATANQEGKNTMYNLHCDNPERSYLSTRLDSEYYTIEMKLESHFNLRETPPETAEDMIERIKAGNYQLKDKKDRCPYSRPGAAIIWRAPGEEPDHDGFKAAKEKALAALRDAQDIVQTSDPEKGLAALNSFKSATFH